MPYTIPSYTVSPGAVYQPRQKIPAIISQNARALYYTRGGSISDSLLLDQSPLNSGTRRTGEEGRCYTGDGTDDYVTTGTSGTSINGKPASIMAWVKISSSRIVFSYPFGAWGSAASRVFCIMTGLSANQIWVAYDNATPMNFTFAGLEDSWHHVAATFDGVNLNLYIDGVLRNQAADTEIANTSFDAAFLSRNNGTNVCQCSIFDVRYYADPLTQDNINYIYTFGKSGIDPTNSSLLSQYKCDEQSGTTAYDSSGNGLTGTLTNITAGTFHATQPIWSFQNQVGFNTSGAVYIPRDESDPTNDVLGNPLTNTGRRPNDASLHSSNCLTADGTLYIAAAHLAGTETVVSSGGTSTPSVSAGRIDFTAGTCWDLTLSDGTHYKLAEGQGIGISDASGAENHGILTSATLASAWGATQSEYHTNLLDGHHLCYQPAIQVYSGANAALIKSISFKFRSTDTKIIIFSDLAPHTAFLLVSNSLGGVGQQTGAGSIAISIDGVVFAGTRVDMYNRICDGDVHEIEISNITFSLGFTSEGVYINSYGTFEWDSTTYLWDLVATDINGDVVPLENEPNVRLPAVTSTTGPYSIPLNSPFIDGFRNRAETEFNYNPDSTPEMGATQLGITVPADHAFGDAFAASTQIFARQRTSTEDRNIVMTEAQTGAALTAIQNYTAP